MTTSLSLHEWPVTDLVQGRVNPRLTWPVIDQSTLVKDKGPIITLLHYVPILKQDATFNPLPGRRGQILPIIFWVIALFWVVSAVVSPVQTHKFE